MNRLLLGQLRFLPLVALGLCLPLSGQTITTLAGGLLLDNQQALSTPLVNPTGIALDSRGSLFILDKGNSVIRKVDPVTRVTTIVAGTGSRLDDSLGIPAGTAATPQPLFALMDGSGNLFFSDASYRVRRITPTGTVTTVAGNGFNGFSGDGGPAIYARLGPPFGLALDSVGNLYIADCYNTVVRKVDRAGIISTVAGNRTFGFSGDGGPATQAQLSCPTSVAFDAAGNMFIVDANNYRLRKVDTAGVITTVAGNGFSAIAADGVQAGVNTPLGAPFYVAVDTSGNLYFSERLGRIRRIAAAGNILSTVAGGSTDTRDGIPATGSYVGQPIQLQFDGSGNLYFADGGQNLVRRIDAVTGLVTTVAGTFNVFDGSAGPAVVLSTPIKLAFDRSGNLLIADQAHHRIRKVDGLTGTVTTLAGTGQPGATGDGGPATAATLQFPAGVAVSASGQILISDTVNNRIRRVDAGTLAIATIAGTGVAGNSGDGGPATQATLLSPDGLAFDAAGNLYVADAGNGLVRRIGSNGTISTVAGNRTYGYSGDGGPATSASLYIPTDVAIDTAGNLLIADRRAHVIRKVDLGTGIITTIAGTGVEGYSGDGGPAIGARLSEPNAIQVDAAGNIFVSDGGAGVVRKITAGTGIISTVAGTPSSVRFLGEGGLATVAGMSPFGLALDSQGNLFISDQAFNRVRKVTPAPVIPVLSVAPQSISFSSPQGGAATLERTFHISSVNLARLTWTVVKQGARADWLTVTPESGSAPSLLTVRADPAGLTAGLYQASLLVTASGATGSPQTVSVSFQVDAASQRIVALSTQALNFQAVSGGINPPAQALLISNAGTGALQWSATVQPPDAANWLTLSASSGTAPAQLFLTLNARLLSPGVYRASVIVQDQQGSSSSTCTVLVTISSQGAAILLSHTGLHFVAVEGGSSLPSQSFSILNTGQGLMNWSATAATMSGGNWLQLTPGSGVSDNSNLANSPTVAATVSAAGLKAGSYGGLIALSSTGAVNNPQVIAAALRVLESGSKPPPLVQPTGLLFSAVAGSQSPLVQNISLFNPGTGQSFSTSSSVAGGGNWLSVTPVSGRLETSNTVSVQVNPSGLATGSYRGTITFSFDGGSVQDAEVLLVVTPTEAANPGAAAELAVCPAQQMNLLATAVPNNFSVPVGYPQTINVRVVDNCNTDVVGATVIISFSTADPPIALADLRNGTYSGTWTPQNGSGAVRLNIRASHPSYPTATAQQSGQLGSSVAAFIATNGVVNAASFRPLSPVAPGSIFSVFGNNLAQGVNSSPGVPLSKTLGNLTLRLGGLEVPLFYAAAGQVNAQMPFEAQPNARLPLVASAGLAVASPEPVTIAAVQPGIFTISQTGSGQGAILNGANIADAAAPATSGGVIVVFCTGLGLTQPQAISGAATPGSPLHPVVNPVTARIGGMDASVQFAGLAPGFVGLYQVNVVVPAGIATGNAVPLVLTQGGRDSNEVTLAIR